MIRREISLGNSYIFSSDLVAVDRRELDALEKRAERLHLALKRAQTQLRYANERGGKSG